MPFIGSRIWCTSNTFLDSNGITSTAQVSAPIGNDALADEIFARLRRRGRARPRCKRLSSLPIRLSQPVWKMHDVALADFDALLLGDFLDLLDVEGGAFLDHVGAVIGRHVEQHAARDHRRDLSRRRASSGRRHRRSRASLLPL